MNGSVCRADVAAAARELGLAAGNLVLIHSSLKSFGYVEGGPEAVISGFRDAVGPSGTLVFPTLSQKNWATVYQDWHIDRPSDVGLITEVFRHLPGALRSDQATHSVAAQGPLAAEITGSHTAYGPRCGVYGDYPFSHSSPWQKMYDLRAKVAFLGVTMRANTFKHFIEYRLAERRLNAISDAQAREALKARLRRYGDAPESGVWPHIDFQQLHDTCEQAGLLRYARCGSALLFCVPVHDMVDLAERQIDKDPAPWVSAPALQWLQDCAAAAQ